MTAWPASPDAPTLAAMQDMTSARGDLEWALSDPKPNAKQIAKAEEAYRAAQDAYSKVAGAGHHQAAAAPAEPPRELEAGG